MRHFQIDQVEVFVHQSTKLGNEHCGDGYYYASTDEYFICVLADGLGSGKNAHESAHAVISVVEQYHHEEVDVIMKKCNDSLFQKRGAAVAILKVHFLKKQFDYSCVGNIRFFLYSPSGKLTYPIPVTGYLSGKPQKFHTQRFPYEQDSRFLIFSDGFQFKAVKDMLNTNNSFHSIAEDLRSTPLSGIDDATFIIGDLR